MSSRWISIVSFLVVSSPAFGQDAKNPLRFVPSHAELVVKVERPLELLLAVEKNALFQDVQKLAVVRDYYDTTAFQQAYQLIAYFEKQLGQSRDEIIGELGAGGVVLGAKLTPPQAVVVVIQSKDEKKLRKFLDVALDILKKELDRQESKDKITRSKYLGHDIGQIGPKASFAIANGALIISNEEKTLKLALEANAKKTNIMQVPGFVEAHKKAPANALAWTWVSLEAARKNPEFKAGLDAASMDPFQMVLFGGFTDLLKRTPYVTAALIPEGKGSYRVAVAMPVGQQGMAPLKHMMVPKDGAAMLPPLQVPRVISSSSYCLDLGELWDKRVEILGKTNAAGLDDVEKNIAKFLAGIKLSKLFKKMGPNHRLVFAQQKEKPYKLKPSAPFPAFALIVDMRDPSFAKDMNSIFRAGALVATFQYGLKLKEDTYKECDMVSYYFSETAKVAGDAAYGRFNYSPTYVTVGNFFVMSGTAELARDLVDALKAEQTQKPIQASMRTHLYSSGLADLIRLNEDATLTQLILSQALPPKTAKEELRAIIDWVDRLGTVRLESHYGINDFRYDILWQPKSGVRGQGSKTPDR